MIGTLGDLVEDIAVHLSGPVNVASDTAATIERRRGGSAANTAVAVVRTGAPARFIGQVGDDPVGRALLAVMASEGVDLAVRRRGRTGTIVVLVDHLGERTMLTDRGACADLTDPDPAWLDGLAVLHVPAYSLVGGLLAATSATLLSWARDRGIVVSIDASSAAIIEAFGPAAMRELLTAIGPDVLLCNELEAAALGGAASLVPLARHVTVVKNGASPALGSAGISAHDSGTDSFTVEVPVPVLAGVLDTTGAGDAFAAGFLVAYSSGATPADSAVAGHRAARAAIVAVSARAQGSANAS